MQNAKIEQVVVADYTHIHKGIAAGFGHLGSWVHRYTDKATAYDLTLKATVGGKLAGFYCLGRKTLLAELNDGDAFAVQEDVSVYRYKAGIEGVALFVFPEFKGLGLASQLKARARQMPYDYIWGGALKSLNNRSQWLKCRRLIAESASMLITLEDLKICTA